MIVSHKFEKLISEKRTKYIVPADYKTGLQLDATIKILLRLIKKSVKYKNKLRPHVVTLHNTKEFIYLSPFFIIQATP